MTDGIQRWHVVRDESMWPSISGTYVLYSDHVAAVKEAEQRILDGSAAYRYGYEGGFSAGQRDVFAKAVAAVEGLWESAAVRHRANWITKAEVIAAIKGVSDE